MTQNTKNQEVPFCQWNIFANNPGCAATDFVICNQPVSPESDMNVATIDIFAESSDDLDRFVVQSKNADSF